MKSCLKKIFALFISVLMLFGTAACNDKTQSGEEAIPVSMPDYSDAGKNFEFFGYTGPTDGTYSLDKVVYDVGEDFRTTERFKEYKDAGMTILMLRYENAYDGEDWATSNAKLCFDKAFEAGIDKIILTDNRLCSLIQTSLPVGDGAAFSTQEAFESYVAECLDLYKDMPGFYGVVLVDEPWWNQLPAYGAVYKAIKKHLPNAYIHSNLYSIGGDLMSRYGADGAYDNLTDAYKGYLKSYLDHSGAKELCFDSYPFKARGEGISTYHYATLKIAAEICKEYGVEMHSVAQSASSFKNRAEFYRACEKSEIYSQLNSFMGFGVTDIPYFTYFTKQESFTDSHNFTDGGSFIDHDGTKTPIYGYAQSIHKEMQEFADTVLSFKYNAASIFTHTPVNFSVRAHTELFVNDTLELIKSFETDNDIALVTELKDGKNGLNMYMVQNIIDPGFADEGRTAMNVTVEFSDGYDYVAVYKKGKLSYKKLDGGKYSTVVSAGYAEFMVPLKSAQ